MLLAIKATRTAARLAPTGNTNCVHGGRRLSSKNFDSNRKRAAVRAPPAIAQIVPPSRLTNCTKKQKTKHAIAVKNVRTIISAPWPQWGAQYKGGDPANQDLSAA